MRLRFLGTGGYHPNQRRHTASIMIPELGIVFDAGTSLFRLPQYLETVEINLFLSHAHLDHIVGLTYLIKPFMTGAIEKMTVHARPQDIDAIQKHLFAEQIFPVPPKFELKPLSDSEWSLPGQGTVSWFPLNRHPGGSTAYRIDWDHPQKSMAYVTDTTVDEAYVSFLEGVDLLIHECYFPDSRAEWSALTGHSHTSQVLDLARRVGAKRLFLTHIDPNSPEDDPVGLTKVLEIFPNTIIAEDLMEIEF